MAKLNNGTHYKIHCELWHNITHDFESGLSQSKKKDTEQINNVNQKAKFTFG